MKRRKVEARTMSSLLECLSSSGYHFSNASAICSCTLGSTSSSIGSSLLPVRSIGACSWVGHPMPLLGWGVPSRQPVFCACALRKASASKPPLCICPLFRDLPLFGLDGALLALIRAPVLVALSFLIWVSSKRTGLPGGRVPLRPTARTFWSW